MGGCHTYEGQTARLRRLGGGWVATCGRGEDRAGKEVKIERRGEGERGVGGA